MEEVSQTERYRAGVYREQILAAVRHRDDIEAVLARHRTKEPPEPRDRAGGRRRWPTRSPTPRTRRADDLARFPFKAYCRQCGRDTTTLSSYDDETTDLAYTCSSCGFSGVTNLPTQDEGKLVWKVDWPMRWAFEHVDFEPAGMDHATPGSSFTVGHELVESVFGMPRPSWFGYAFVGFAGVQKMSSSAGGVPTAADALRGPGGADPAVALRAPQPKQAFDIDFGPEVVRLYDEWDALGRKAADPASATVPCSPTSGLGDRDRRARCRLAGRVPFRVLSSVADVTAGSAGADQPVVGDVGYPHDSVDDLEPRLSQGDAVDGGVRAGRGPDHRPRPTPDADRAGRRWSAGVGVAAAAARPAAGRRRPRARPVTALVYGVPKLARGLALDDAPTDEVKADQKEFFRLLYHLLVDAERGPRLPTLIVALGADKVRSLLGAPSA